MQKRIIPPTTTPAGEGTTTEGATDVSFTLPEISVEAIPTMTTDVLLAPSTIRTLHALAQSEDDWYATQTKMRMRAGQLHCKTELNQTLKKMEKAFSVPTPPADAIMAPGLTCFSDLTVQYRCEGFTASDNGIYSVDEDGNFTTISYCPVYPVRRSKNVESLSEQVTLRFKRKGDEKPTELTVPAVQIATATKIVELAEVGFPVNSETARGMVKYLSTILELNTAIIPLTHSSSKFGWHMHDGKQVFLPYDDSEQFFYDADNKTAVLTRSVHTAGSHIEWKKTMIEIRQTKRCEVLLTMSAALSSLLVPIVGVNSFVLDLYGKTGMGKTVTMMLAASQFANPDHYIGSFDTTDVGVEIRLDALNHLPLMLDDSNHANKKLIFNDFIMMICNGLGRQRGNKALGIRRDNTWKNCTITTGEAAMRDLVTGGGSKNRIISVRCRREEVYKDGNALCEFIRKNYGYAGRAFVYIVKQVGERRIKEIWQDYKALLEGDSVTAKQAASLALIMTADELMETYYYKDSVRIDLEDARDCLSEKENLDVDQRMYDYLIDTIDMHPKNFCPYTGPITMLTDPKGEIWGYIDDNDGYVYMIATALRKIFERTEFRYSKAFVQWMHEKGYDPYGESIVRKIPSIGKNQRVYKIKMERRGRIVEE